MLPQRGLLRRLPPNWISGIPGRRHPTILRQLMNDFDIRLAEESDEGEIRAFIHDHWKRDHIFCEHPELMLWQHRDPDRPGGLTFVLARSARDNAIVGLLGYIPSRRFDPQLGQDFFLAIWKVRDGVAGLGLALPMYFRKAVRPRLTGAIGLSPMVIPIYKALGFTTGQLSQWTITNPKTRNPALFEAIPHRDIVPDDRFGVRFVGDVNALEAHAADLDRLGGAALPRKSWRQIVSRYGRHPCYRYEAMLIQNRDGHLAGVLIFREASAAGASCLRGVDFIGGDDALAGSAFAMREEIEGRGAEFIDLYAHGLDGGRLFQAGFCDAQTEQGMVVANYFEPFEKRSVTLDFAYRLEGRENEGCVRLFKGDSDQDRPNSWPRPVLAEA